MILGGIRVLLIEDSREARHIFAALLRTEGAEVAEAGSGLEAVELARTGEFDVVLSDLGLPDIPGDVLIRHLAAVCPGRPRVAVITGHGEPHLTRARAAGAHAIFRKPVEWERVIAYLRGVQGRHAGVRA